MRRTLTAVSGITVGHAHDLDALTGCTVVLLPEGTTCGVDVRGGAPGTRETDLLAPTAMMRHINAICLAGGSAFGLAAATGVVDWLHEREIGFDVGVTKVPIVPAAVLFDLRIGRCDRWPDAAMGYQACENASAEEVAEGCVGAGAGATVGKLMGIDQATKSGLGSAATLLHGDVTVAALAVTNAFGSVHRENSGAIIAGPRDDERGMLDTIQVFREIMDQSAPRPRDFNTTLCVVATDATLDKTECRKLAQMAQNALARTIRPVHTPFDGDIVFAVATGQRPALPMALMGSIAADVLVEAIERSVLLATAAGGLPASRDVTRHSA
jgi:L-aminopeptidase/D-esterase-like protein